MIPIADSAYGVKSEISSNYTIRSDHSALLVNIKTTATFFDLKKAILAENISALAHVDLTRLTLVRVFKEGVGGFTKRDISTNGRSFRVERRASIQKEGVFFKSFTRVGARTHKEIQVFCALAENAKLSMFPVRINPTAFVFEFNEAVHAHMSQKLTHVNNDGLTLIRVFKKGVGGLTMSDLEKWTELHSKPSYGRDPQNGIDEISMFRTSRGACMEKEGSFFKVMNPMSMVCVYLDSTPDDLYHVLVLSLRESKPAQLQGSGCSGTEVKSNAVDIKWKDEQQP
ncbi:hypothetical protein BJ741DRAFT_670970 [Chytriomyces cf. hyalinus JEL632]|nr:hypothetical protein BJ741DRAFT_670970 [Chytriomyces cf. hyalinus JEL632]